jgi:hypothetical protein
MAMKYWWAIPIILIQRFNNRLMNFRNGRLLGEELIAVYRAGEYGNEILVGDSDYFDSKIQQ